ncbi:glutaredoxin family protein [Thermocrispum municipale]|jgi:glutaredoxin|uniref:glutaredoxin family protein n=1 Tax=Thermocrispum municipale TaxID=37926 RepID=UPI00040A5428|nr:glutaredoxin family protein [Thermocrispum municipale]
MPEVTVVSRANCHLCEVAEQEVDRICGELEVPWRTVDVDSDPELRAEYGDLVPVILIDGVQHGYWRVEEERFRAALAAAK